MGGAGGDSLSGGADDGGLGGDGGNDTPEGGEGYALACGDEGNDWLDGGAGNDTLTAARSGIGRRGATQGVRSN